MSSVANTVIYGHEDFIQNHSVLDCWILNSVCLSVLVFVSYSEVCIKYFLLLIYPELLLRLFPWQIWIIF